MLTGQVITTTLSVVPKDNVKSNRCTLMLYDKCIIIVTIQSQYNYGFVHIAQVYSKATNPLATKVTTKMGCLVVIQRLIFNKKCSVRHGYRFSLKMTTYATMNDSTMAFLLFSP